MKFAKIVFWIASIWGLLVITPLYFFFDLIGQKDPPAITHPGFFYGFVGCAFAWQVAFCFLATDPVRYRPLMIPSVLEKASCGYPGRARTYAPVGPAFRRHGLLAGPSLRDRLLQNPAQLICLTSSSQEPAYIEEGGRPGVVLPGAEGRPAIPVTAVLVFSLDGGSQWEDTSCTTAPD